MNLPAQVQQKMQTYFGSDQRRISHALQVLQIAEQIAVAEKTNLQLVKIAAILHDIGIHNSQRRYNSTAGRYQQIEGPPVARKIMTELDIDNETIEHVCDIIANHHSGGMNTMEFNCIWDADRIVNFAEEYPAHANLTETDYFDQILRTQTGKRIARANYTGIIKS
ncbi:putative domain HDIG [Anaerohalosphaera lusitana]|uniref:Putative domain HDIG n=1 Tax=Anaerohalosphaera lusitana TaxID=1936003 RepID=A0A1U9NIZ4_9BACT|nr:HD domain-containing protein [Anaerohalosphaera lusitana]AQT67708.1 putative domain HDIG [Anaerohalosphaera lusitana]